jgi:hypothetical protein
MGNAIRSRVIYFAAVVTLLGSAATPTASAQTTVGGHIGILVPWVTHAGGNTTSVFDTFSLGLPFGISVKGQSRMFVDFEFIPHINEAPHQATLTVDPGLMWGLDHGFTVGLRATFNVNSSSIGFVPVVNKSWKLPNQSGFFKTFFGEIDVPVTFDRPKGGPATNPVTFATQFGLGF